MSRPGSDRLLASNASVPVSASRLRVDAPVASARPTTPALGARPSAPSHAPATASRSQTAMSGRPATAVAASGSGVPSRPGTAPVRSRKDFGPLSGAERLKEIRKREAMDAQKARAERINPEVKAERPAFWSDAISGMPKEGKKPRSRKLVEYEAKLKREKKGLPPPGATRAAAGTLERLEGDMKLALSRFKKPFEGSRQLLVQRFREADSGGKVHEGGKPTGLVSKDEFIAVWDSFEVHVSRKQALQLFTKYGMTREGKLPYEVFARTLTTGAAKLLGMSKIRKGAYEPDESTDFRGKILYPQCKKGVFAPTSWKPEDGERSGEVPKADLELEFVYGYAGLSNLSNNIYFTDRPDEIVYYTAGLGIVYNKTKHEQRYFCGHDDDITALAIHPNRRLMASGQLGKYPLVCIWDNDSCEEVAALEHPDGMRGVTSCCFSADGTKLVTVCADNPHTVFVWDWVKGKVITTAGGFQGEPPQVYGCKWNPFHVSEMKNVKGADGNDGLVKSFPPERQNQFFTYGVNHLKRWDWNSQKGLYEAKTLSYTTAHRPFDILCLEVLPSGVLLTGDITGCIAEWVGGKCVRRVPAHRTYVDPISGHLLPKPVGGVSSSKPKAKSATVGSSAGSRVGPPAATPRGATAGRPKPVPVDDPADDGDDVDDHRVVPPPPGGYGGLRCLRLRADHQILLSAGADGTIHRWDVSGGRLKGWKQIANPPEEPTSWKLLNPTPKPMGAKEGEPKSIKVTTPYKREAPPQFRGLDCRPGSKCFVAGTNKCDIWEIDDDQPTTAVKTLIYGHTADLYGIAWHPLRPNVFATACESERVFVWDAEARELLRTCSIGYKGRSCAFSSDGKHLAVGTRSGRVRVLDAETLQPLYGFQDQFSAVDELKYSPDNKFLAVAGHDMFIDIYATGAEYAHVARCSGHSATVSHIDWSADSRLLQSTDNAYEILYWNPRTGRQILENQRDTNWATFTCIVGYSVMGIWESGMDGTDINAVDRSSTGEYLVASDDLSHVRLLNYPCVVEEAPAKVYNGHSSHVTNIRFSSDDTWVCSVGSRDRAVLQWRTRGIKPGEAPPEEKEEVEEEKVWGALDETGKNFGWVRPPKQQPSAQKGA